MHDTMYDKIYDLVQSKDLLEANQLLKSFDEALANQSVNRPTFCKKLSQAIVEWTYLRRNEDIFSDARPMYYIYPASDAVPPYLGSFGLTRGNVREMRGNIRSLIAAIDKTIIEPTGISISTDVEEKVLSTLSSKFPFFQIVSSRKPFSIININNTHRLFNSMCGVSGDATSFVVYMFNMKDKSLAPEYVFLHELGHILQITLSGSDELVPNEFLEFHTSLPTVNKLEQGNPDAAEVFADTFAISVMRGTDLRNFNPFQFPDSLIESFENFYVTLFEKYCNALAYHQT